MSVYREIIGHLQSLANADDARQLSRFFKTGKGEYGEGDLFVGIRVPQIRQLAKSYKQAEFSVIEKLLPSKFHEYRTLALIMMIEHYKKADVKKQKYIYQYYLDNKQYINNWDLIDISAKHILGAYLFSRNRKPLFQLVKSKKLWDRRLALLATFYFIAQHDFADSLEMAAILLNDREDLIHKAVGWMLREIGNRDLNAEEEFLQQYYQLMPRTMLRYAIEKFPEKRRQQYLHGKV